MCLYCWFCAPQAPGLCSTCFAPQGSTDVLHAMQSAAEAADMRAHANSWALAHKKMLFKAPLPAALEHRIRLWFQSLRPDHSLEKSCSGALSKDEMAAAMEMGEHPFVAPTCSFCFCSWWLLYITNHHHQWNARKAHINMHGPD
jgi:hypothetical protein